MTLGELKELIKEASISLYDCDEIEVVYAGGELQIRKAENIFGSYPKKMNVEILKKTYEAKEIFANNNLCDDHLYLDEHSGQFIELLNFPTESVMIVEVKDQEGRQYHFTNANRKCWGIHIPVINGPSDVYIGSLTVRYYITGVRMRRIKK